MSETVPANECVKNKSPLKAIRAHCLECVGGSYREVKLCPCTKCELYPFRFGKNPFRKVSMSDEQKAAIAERLKNARFNNAENG